MVKKAPPGKRAPVQTARPAKQTEPAEPVRIGVISDTHGYLDPRVLELFAGVTHIIHAGDIMDPKILRALMKVAPVTAVAATSTSRMPWATCRARSRARSTEYVSSWATSPSVC
jgi:hypothetical protein